MKIRVKFKKWGCMKFIGHLDMMSLPEGGQKG